MTFISGLFELDLSAQLNQDNFNNKMFLATLRITRLGRIGVWGGNSSAEQVSQFTGPTSSFHQKKHLSGSSLTGYGL